MSDFECLPIGTAARLAQLEAEVERLRALLSEASRLIDRWASNYGTGPTHLPPAGIVDLQERIDAALNEGQR